MARKKTKSDTDPSDPDGLVLNGAEQPGVVVPSDLDLVLEPPAPEPEPTPPPIPPVAVPTPSAETLLVPIEERMRKLEEAITKLSQAPPAREPPPSPVAPIVMGTAQALVEAGRQFMPPMRLATPTSHESSGRFGYLGEILVELQAIYFMYVDPRYRLTWVGRVVPPILLVLFATTDWWLKYAFCGLGAIPFVDRPVQLLLCYLLIKVVGAESRLYRQTAPDLPAHLRP